MRRVLFVGLLMAGAASAQSGQAAGLQPVLASANASQLDEGIYASPDKPLSLVLKPELCDGAQPMRWRDASDALRFASQPLAQLSSGGAGFAELRPFLELRFTPVGGLELLFAGASVPTLGHLQLVPADGWRLAC